MTALLLPVVSVITSKVTMCLSSSHLTPLTTQTALSVSVKVKVRVKVRVLSLDPKLVLTTSQFYLAGLWKWPHSYILSFRGISEGLIFQMIAKPQWNL